MMQFILDHKTEIISVGVAIFSEFMALNPKWKSNGIIDFFFQQALKLKASQVKPE